MCIAICCFQNIKLRVAVQCDVFFSFVCFSSNCFSFTGKVVDIYAKFDVIVSIASYNFLCKV